MFRTVPLSIIRSFSLYTQQWYMSYRFAVSKNKIEKSVHLVGFTVRLYHDAWPPERQTGFTYADKHITVYFISII